MRKIRAKDGRGLVTAELAVTTLAAFAVLTMMCWGIYLVVTQLRCVDTAAAVARQAARGDTTAVGQGQGCSTIRSDDFDRQASEPGHRHRASQGSTVGSLAAYRAPRGSRAGGSRAPNRAEGH